MTALRPRLAADSHLPADDPTTCAQASILAIDPGTTASGWVLLAAGRVLRSEVVDNAAMLELVRSTEADVLAVEMIASYGMAVGREVFETCVWIGRFLQTWREPGLVRLVYRRDVKLHLCGSPRAKDPNIRQALLDRLGPAGTKKAPGPTYGVKSHAWAALAVAVTVSDSLLQPTEAEMSSAGKADFPCSERAGERAIPHSDPHSAPRAPQFAATLCPLAGAFPSSGRQRWATAVAAPVPKGAAE